MFWVHGSPSCRLEARCAPLLVPSQPPRPRLIANQPHAHMMARTLAFPCQGSQCSMPASPHQAIDTTYAVRFMDDAVFRELGIRLVAWDRPGYGQSDPQPQRSFQTFAGVSSVPRSASSRMLRPHARRAVFKVRVILF